MNKLKAHSFVLLATLIIGGSFLASAHLPNGIHPFSLNLMRFLIAFLCLMPFVIFRRISRRQVKHILWRSLVISFFFCGYFVSLFSALRTTTVLNTGTLYTLTPFITAILSIFIFKERVNVKRILAYVLGAFGTVWVVFKGDFNAMLLLSLNQGDLIFMLGVLSMCGYTISMKLLYRNDSVLVMTFCTLLGGTLWMALACVVFGISLDWQKMEGSAYLNMAYLSIAATFFTSYLYQKASIALNPSSVTAYIYLSPACIALLSLLLYGQTVTPTILFGIGISMVATLVLQLMSVKPKSRLPGHLY